MWILPKQIISAFAVDTEALTSDSAAASQTCAQSLMVRSKPQRANYFLRAWKAGNLTRLRSGVISSPFLGGLFTAKWTSSLADILVSLSAPQESEPEKTTLGTSGLGLQMEFLNCSPNYVFLKTSKGTFRWDSPASLAIWKSWVTRCRGDYSARLNAARRTSESGCLFWPTAAARDWKDIGDLSKSDYRSNGKLRKDTLPRAVDLILRFGQVAPVNPSTHGSRPESSGKLNPRWVETLMGLPVGWTMVSCASPVTIESTNSACLGTESW
jgi:hypothetical protein